MDAANDPQEHVLGQFVRIRIIEHHGVDHGPHLANMPTDQGVEIAQFPRFRILLEQLFVGNRVHTHSCYLIRQSEPGNL
jgi:hypothetical protein